MLHSRADLECLLHCQIYHALQLVLAPGLGNQQVVLVSTCEMVSFGSRQIQLPDPDRHGRPYMLPDLSCSRFCRTLLHTLIPESSVVFRGFLFMVRFRYPTIKGKILTLVRHYVCLLNWLPLYSK